MDEIEKEIPEVVDQPVEETVVAPTEVVEEESSEAHVA